MSRIPHIILIAAAGLSSCATERTVTNTLRTNPERSAKTDEELSKELLDRFAGGFGVKRGKDGDAKMVSDRRSSFEGLRYNGDTSEFEKKAFATTAFEKKKFEGASSKFETRQWDGVKSFTEGKMDTPDFIAHARGVNTQTWEGASKQYATRKSDFQEHAWKDAGKQVAHTANQDIETKRQNFEQPAIMNARQAQARTIQETREMMGRTD